MDELDEPEDPPPELEAAVVAPIGKFVAVEVPGMLSGNPLAIKSEVGVKSPLLGSVSPLALNTRSVPAS